MHYLFTYRFKENFIAFFFFFCAVFAAMRRIKRKLKLTANEIGMGDETDTIIKYLSCFFFLVSSDVMQLRNEKCELTRSFDFFMKSAKEQRRKEEEKGKTVFLHFMEFDTTFAHLKYF